MGKVILVANQKGGVAKTTTVTNLSDGLRKLGFKVLTVDLDPQCNATKTFDAKIENENTLYDVIFKECTPTEAIQHTYLGDIIAGDKELSQPDSVFTNLKQPFKFKILDDICAELKDVYDFIILDSPPDLGPYLTNGLMKCDYVIIPSELSSYSIDGLETLIEIINEIKVPALNPNVNILGILITNYNTSRTSVNKKQFEILSDICERNNIHIFDSRIRICSKVVDAQSDKKSLFELDPKGNASNDYFEFIQEMLTEIKNK